MYQKPTNIEEAILECAPVMNKFVRKYQRNHYQERADLMQCAYEGILIAWDKYCKKGGTFNNKFSTYAGYWIWHKCKEYAFGRWDHLNNEKELLVGIHDQQYEMDDIDIDVERYLAKLNGTQRNVFSMRMAGETFQTISEHCGLKSLHEARNIYKEVEKKMAV